MTTAASIQTLSTSSTPPSVANSEVLAVRLRWDNPEDRAILEIITAYKNSGKKFKDALVDAFSAIGGYAPSHLRQEEKLDYLVREVSHMRQTIETGAFQSQATMPIDAIQVPAKNQKVFEPSPEMIESMKTVIGTGRGSRRKSATA